MTFWATLVVDNIGRLATMSGDGLGEVEDAIVIVDGERIAYAGAKAGAPTADFRGVQHVVDAGGRAVVPGLIDCHTHLLFAGDRADEFARRARGESYQQIMEAGGGIRSTMKAVRDATILELVEATAPRVSAMKRRGITTIEIKSGYGLDVENELKMLRAIRALANAEPVDIVPTLLAAHAVPPEFERDPRAWIGIIVRDLLPEVAREKLATTCDVFVEAGAFNAQDARPMLQRAKELGLGVRVHAEQLSHSGGARLAAELGAVSAGHLEHVDGGDIEALARTGVVCEVLSIAQAFLRGQQAIPGRALVDGGCTVAVATDCNPGTAMSTDIALAAGLAVTQCGLTAEEALRGITINAAKALSLDDRGVIAEGKRADLVILEGRSPIDLVYRWGEQMTRTVVANGKVL